MRYKGNDTAANSLSETNRDNIGELQKKITNLKSTIKDVEKSTENINAFVKRSDRNDSTTKSVFETLLNVVQDNSEYVESLSLARRETLHNKLITLCAGMVVMRFILLGLHISELQTGNILWIIMLCMIGVQTMLQLVIFIFAKKDKHAATGSTHLTGDIPLIKKNKRIINLEVAIALCSVINGVLGTLRYLQSREQSAEDVGKVAKSEEKNTKSAMERLESATTVDEKLAAIQELVSSFSFRFKVIMAGMNFGFLALNIYSAFNYKEPDYELVSVKPSKSSLAQILADVLTVAA